MIQAFRRIFPFIQSLGDYNSTLFRSDFYAGVIVGIMLIPQGLAYAFLAGMPPVYGLYAAVVPLIVYSFFGTSRHMSIGPVAISSLLVLAGISKFAAPFSEDYIQLVLLSGFMIGILQFALGIIKWGALVNFISHPVITGFTGAAAIIIAVNQIKDVLGITVPSFQYSYQTFLYVIERIEETHLLTAVIGLGGLSMMFIIKNFFSRLPHALLLVVISILLTYFFELDKQGLSIVGDVPEGLPALIVPNVEWSNIKMLFPVVLTVTLIGIVESISIARVLENKHQSYVVHPNQELIALGLSKITGSFFQAIPTSGSFSRSAINDESGAKTTVSSLIAAFLVILTLAFLTPLFYYLPKAVLGAIILIAVQKLLDIKEAKHLWKTHRPDFILMLITFLATLLLGIEIGVFLGIFLSLFVVLYRSSKPDLIILGKVPGTTYYRSIERFQDAEEVEGKLILRFDNQLYYGNASHFKKKIKSTVNSYSEDVKELLLDAKSIHYIDSSGLKALNEINNFLDKKNIKLVICGAVGVVRDTLRQSGFLKKIGENRHFIYLHQAIEKPNENE